MPKKRLTIFGTRHYGESLIPGEIKSAFEFVLDKIRPDVVLEEWSETRIDKSAAAAVARSMGIPWKSIGTPDEPQFGTFGYSNALDFPTSANINRHGPFDVQERRETVMRDHVIREMANFQRGVLIVGLAHLHSLSVKLAGDIDVRSYGYGLELF